MTKAILKTKAQKEGEASVNAFRLYLGPFVVAAEKTRMPIVFTDEQPGHYVVFANNAFLALTGYSREEVLGKSFQSLLAVGVDAKTMTIVEAAFRGKCESAPEINYRRKDGSEFMASMEIQPVCDESGTVVQQFASFIDLTAHRQDNARYKRLIDELNHRVKNTLSTVQSIINLALRQPAEPAAIREAIESRILALSRSHDLLTTGNWEGTGLRDLVDTVLHPFEAAGQDERFTIVGDNVHLSPKMTLSLAVAFHELATNAVKFGALSNDTGSVAIDWTVSSQPEGDQLLLQWRECYGPKVTPPTRRGFGSWVIERGLAHELGGKVTLDYFSDGVACTIDVPILTGAEE